jgi:hypothetical protein
MKGQDGEHGQGTDAIKPWRAAGWAAGFTSSCALVGVRDVLTGFLRHDLRWHGAGLPALVPAAMIPGYSDVVFFATPAQGETCVR